MTSGGGWDNHISYYGYGSSGSAWMVNGNWQHVTNQTIALDVGNWRETPYFSPSFVTQQYFSVGCNDGETMGVDVFYRFNYDPTSTIPPPSISCSLDGVNCYWKNCTTDIFSGSAKTASLSEKFRFTFDNQERIAAQAILLYRVRDEILSTSEDGHRYIDLYYTHSAEIASIMNSNPTLAEQGLDAIDALTPNLQALLNGQGSSATITNAQVQQAQAFLDAILPYASPQLQQAIAEERARQPLEQLSGMTMNQAWEEINTTVTQTATSTLTVTTTLTPTETTTLTPTETSTPTPTETVTPTFTPSPTETVTPTPTETETLTPTFTLSPTETSGPTQTATVTLTPTLTATPISYSFTGFFPPVDNQPTLNVVKAGNAVPVKFSLNGDQGLNIFADGYPASMIVACGSSAEDAIEQTVMAGSSSLSYDAATDQYVYIWKTDKAWADTCRTLVVKLSDGTYHRANFKFRK